MLTNISIIINDNLYYHLNSWFSFYSFSTSTSYFKGGKMLKRRRSDEDSETKEEKDEGEAVEKKAKVKITSDSSSSSKDIDESKKRSKPTVLSREPDIELVDCPFIFLGIQPENYPTPVDPFVCHRVASKPSEWAHQLFCHLPGTINFTREVGSDEENSDDDEGLDDDEDEKEKKSADANKPADAVKEMSQTIQGVSYVLQAKDNKSFTDLDGKKHSTMTIMMMYKATDKYSSDYTTDPLFASYSWYPSYDDPEDEVDLMQEQAHQLLAKNIGLASNVTLRILCPEQGDDEDHSWTVDSFLMPRKLDIYGAYGERMKEPENWIFSDAEKWCVIDGPCDWQYGEANITWSTSPKKEPTVP